ncbi:MAG: hypothetical protein DRG78_10355 [Epsilonproteobacteria bacterium]|nr:MAG: hypothetical protein DRG78_10355 [Campylobacterota bacterium]
MKIIGIDPAPSKKSIVFDGEIFLELTPIELKNYIEALSKNHDSIFISWDAPLSAAIDKENFSLTIRKIERFFNRLGRHAKELGIPEGISTLGYSGCPHWSISQYIFGLPILNPSLQQSSKFNLVMNEADINEKGYFITEIHPALSMWILLRDELKENELFKDSWKYKGDNKLETIKRRTHLIDELLRLNIVKTEIDIDKITINTDDQLDAFVCWLIARLLFKQEGRAKIYGDRLNGSFLLAYDKEIYSKLNSYLNS